MWDRYAHSRGWARMIWTSSISTIFTAAGPRSAQSLVCASAFQASGPFTTNGLSLADCPTTWGASLTTARSEIGLARLKCSPLVTPERAGPDDSSIDLAQDQT